MELFLPYFATWRVTGNWFRSLLFFMTMSIKRSWLQNKNKCNFLKIFWEPSFKITYFQKRFVHGLLVLGSLPKGSETSFWFTFSACFLTYKYCLLNCVSTDQVSIPDLLYFSLCFFNYRNDGVTDLKIYFWSSYAIAGNGEKRVRCA